mmetsp:Transcript_129049/g.192284  ORF Transcript_129049/g.192284 Transcript_129049/m.192284 type:complete len:121 (-) Transcript_129049:66-428(-)
MAYRSLVARSGGLFSRISYQSTVPMVYRRFESDRISKRTTTTEASSTTKPKVECWNCNSCGFFNFPSRINCKACGHARQSDLKGAYTKREGDWKCECGYNNYASRANCKSCGIVKKVQAA